MAQLVQLAQAIAAAPVRDEPGLGGDVRHEDQRDDRARAREAEPRPIPHLQTQVISLGVIEPRQVLAPHHGQLRVFFRRDDVWIYSGVGRRFV